MSDQPVRVVIADDQEAVRQAFTAVLDSHPRITVVGQAADGLGALELTTHLRPDVLVADIRMPRMDGLEVCRRLQGHPRTKVLVVTTFDLDEYVASALANGAHGFVLKRSRPELLVAAVLSAASGDTLISPQLTLRLLRDPRMNPAHPSHGAALLLTPREQDVAREVALGRTNAEIGTQLFITAGTVKTHLASIQTKLGVKNRVGIASWAWAHGLTEAGPPPE